MWSYRGAKFIFKKIFGQYFQYELEKDQFDIGFKKGTINLSNLELNVRRINAELTNFPLALSSGYLGNIHTKVPYTSLWDKPSEFIISDLELSFVSSENYENIVLNKLSELEYQHATNSSTGGQNDDYIQGSGSLEHQYYSDEDEEVDKIQSRDESLGGLELLAEMIKKLVDKVSAKMNNCSVSITHYDKKRNKSIIMMLLIESLEYVDDKSMEEQQQQQQQPTSPRGNQQQQQQEQQDKFSYFYKMIKLANFSIKIAETDGNILILDQFYTGSILNCVQSSLFQTIFTNRKETNNNSNNSSSTDLHDFINLKIKRTEKNSNLPLFSVDCNFKDWTILLSPIQLGLLKNFMKLFKNNNNNNSSTSNNNNNTNSNDINNISSSNSSSSNKNIDILNTVQDIKSASSISSLKTGSPMKSPNTHEIPNSLENQQINTNSNSSSSSFSIQFKWSRLRVFLFHNENCNINTFLQQHFHHQPYQVNFFVLHLQDFLLQYSQSTHSKQITANITKFNLFQHVVPSPLEPNYEISDNNHINPNLYSIIQFHDNTIIAQEKSSPYDISLKINFIYQNEKKSYDREINLQMKDLSIYFYPYLLVSGQSLMDQINELNSSSGDLEIKEKKKYDNSSPIIRSSNSYENILTELKNTSFRIDGDENSTNYDISDENDSESTSTQLHIHSSLIKLIIKFPVSNCDNINSSEIQKQLRPEIVTISATNVKIVANLIKDIKDVKWFIDFDDIHANLINEMNDIVRFLEISTKDPSSAATQGITPLEITIRGSVSAYSNYDVDLNSPPIRSPVVHSATTPSINFNASSSGGIGSQHSTYQTLSDPLLSSPSSSPSTSPASNSSYRSCSSTSSSPSSTFSKGKPFNPFNHTKERHKGPFSSFVSTSEGIFDNSWLGEAEQDEMSSFRHSSIESSKYVLNIVLPFLKFEIKKDELNLLVNLFNSLVEFQKNLSKTNQSDKQIEQPQFSEQIYQFQQKALSASASKSTTPKNISLLSVLLIVNKGHCILTENESSNSPLSSSSSSISSNNSNSNQNANNSSNSNTNNSNNTSTSPPPTSFYKYWIEFERFELFNVVKYYGRDITFINCSFQQLELKEADLSQRDSQPPRSIISKTLASNKLLPSAQSLSALISINNDDSEFLDEAIDGKVVSLVFNGVTVEHRVNSIWYTRLSEFFSFDDENSNSNDNQLQIIDPNNNNNSNSNNSQIKTFLNFIDCSIYFLPTSNLTSAAIFFFADTKIKLMDSKKISCNGQNSNIFVIDDILNLKESSPTTSSHSSVYNYWKYLGFEPSVYLDYFEFEILKSQQSYPKFSLKFNHNNLSISACADSFFVLNEIISNLLGLDIPYAEVADLIITQGIAPDLKENIDILINEDTFKSNQMPFNNGSGGISMGGIGGGGSYGNLLDISNSSSSPSPSPQVNSFSNTPNLEFEDFEDDPASFTDLTDDEGTFYEYHSPPTDFVSNKMSDSTTSLEDQIELSLADTSSQTSTGVVGNGGIGSTAPILGSVMIEDYDHEKLESFQSNNQHNLINEYNSSGGDDQVYYMDLEQFSDYKPPNIVDDTPTTTTNNRYSSSSNSNNNNSNQKDGIANWLDPRYTAIDIIENYISQPGEDPEDTNLPSNYPKSQERFLFSKMNISLKIYKGSDWDSTINNSLNNNTSNNTNNKSNSNSNINYIGKRDPNSFVEFIFSGFNLRIDKFDEKEKVAKLLTFNLCDFTIIDHIPSSLWNKFLCSDTNVTRYQQSPMVKIQLETVRPDLNRPLLQENKLKVLILPLCFNVDQDTVMFMINYFSYRPPVINNPNSGSIGGNSTGTNNSANVTGNNNNESPTKKKRVTPHGAVSRTIPEDKAKTTDKEAQEITYFQSCEIHPIRLKVDYKPKKVDYHSLTSGNYAELLNLLPLEGAVFNLNRLKLTGVGGWGALFNQIGKQWVPHIINTQLLGYISGVRGINSLVHVGESLANLVVLPLEQYKKDGKVFKGLKKGTSSFLKNLTLETLTVGAKMAVGTQGLLETADNALSSKSSGGSGGTSGQQTNTGGFFNSVGGGMSSSYNSGNFFSQTGSSSGSGGGVGNGGMFNQSKFSDQPVDTKEGIQHAYESVSREIKSAAHTIIAIPMKEYQQKGTKGYMKSMVKAVPIAIIRPMIGLTEGVSKTLLGVRNQIDPQKKAEMDNKYKKAVYN